jgi:hypothetical protein
LRGAQLGDKTILDAIVPALDKIEELCANGQPDFESATRFPLRLAMNKFVNLPDHCFAEMLEGIALANPDKLKYVPRQRRIFRCQ